MRARKGAFLALQVALAALFAWLAWRKLSPEFDKLGGTWSSIDLDVLPLAASAVFVIVAYLILIETWRLVIAAWGGSIPYGTAARIWFLSNLGRYLPGKVWSIAAMGVLSERAGVSPAVAVTSSLYINAINLLAGFVVCLFAAPDVLPFSPAWTIALGVATVVFVFTPRALTGSIRWAAAKMGKDFALVPLDFRTVALTFGSCAVAWVCYGIAFQFIAAGTIGDPSGATLRYIALYTSSYLAGYVALFAPGGVGVREFVMIAQADRYGLMPTSSVALLAVISRIWITLFELLPGLLLLVVSPKSPSNETRTH
jgi:glycosyltransferase 2 family protein